MAHLLVSAVSIVLAMQAAAASIVGTVRDAETRAALPGAVVVLTELDRTTVTDAEGRYVLRDVPAGPHHVTVRRIGYAPRALHALAPRTGELEINVALTPAALRLPAVEVRAPIVIRGVEEADSVAFPDRTLSIEAVANHPLLAEPDALQALGGGDVVLAPESPEGVHIRGGESDQTAYLIDGIPVFSPLHVAGVASAWNPDALSRLDLTSSVPAPDHPHALAGTIEAFTRAPGARLRAQGSVTTTQTRLTLDGPLSGNGAGYVMGFRTGLHDVVAPRNEPDFLRGGTGDWLGKIELPAWGGIRLLGTGNDNEIDASSSSTDPAARRNRFQWNSRSLGGEWRREDSVRAVRVLGWSATGDAHSAWASHVGPIAMSATRRDEGMLATFEHHPPHATTIAALRLEQSRTEYRVASDSASGPTFSLDARTPVATAIARHARDLGPRVALDVGSALAAGAGAVHASPGAELRWNASERLSVSCGCARSHQFAQSLRNAESIVGNVFPADAHAGAGARGIPVARSDQVVLAADYRPLAGVHLGVQAYARASDGVVLVAPRDGEPFSTGAFAIGSSRSRGVSAELAARSTRYGIVASYGLQRVRFSYGDSSYVPDFGATHLLEGGVIVFPTATASVRLGATALFGRRTTAIPGAFEWESCNLLDHGCEFVGTPYYGDEPLGVTRLPAYVRVDLGVRAHWHMGVAGRDALMAVFGTYTNLLGRSNLLTYARDPATGERVGIELRPPAVLVVGLDWRF